MAFTFVPDYRFEKFDDITADFLISIGINGVLLDIDNTLEPYENAHPGERVVNWLKSLALNGIKAAIVSNNDRERVELFNKELGLPAYYKSGKPSAKNLKRAMAAMGSSKSNTAVLGDQLITNVCAGKHIGLRALLVPPIKDRTSAFFRFKRALEVPKIKKFVRTQKEHPEDALACAFWLERRYRIVK
jgi:HAD superfamily phosphatase (TIGR01668 family)